METSLLIYIEDDVDLFLFSPMSLSWSAFFSLDADARLFNWSSSSIYSRTFHPFLRFAPSLPWVFDLTRAGKRDSQWHVLQSRVQTNQWNASEMSFSMSFSVHFYSILLFLFFLPVKETKESRFDHLGSWFFSDIKIIFLFVDRSSTSCSSIF